MNFYHFIIPGECSANRILRGKHYNNAMRGLKYIYNAFAQMRIQHMEEWLVENEYPPLKNYTEANEFSSFVDKVN